jgi:hypothetical protein
LRRRTTEGSSRQFGSAGDCGVSVGTERPATAAPPEAADADRKAERPEDHPLGPSLSSPLARESNAADNARRARAQTISDALARILLAWSEAGMIPKEFDVALGAGAGSQRPATAAPVDAVDPDKKAARLEVGLPGQSPTDLQAPESNAADADDLKPRELEPMEAQPGDDSAKSRRKRGPTPDYETASRVAEIVARVAPDGDWRSKWGEICEALDDEKILFPQKWLRARQCKCWSDCIERPIVIKAIEYRLKTANQRKKTTPETFS